MSTTTEAPQGATAPTPPGGVSRLWDRQLPHYPETGPRSLYLAITVLATVVLYYELYVGGAVATQIIAEFGMSFTVFVFVSVIGNAGRRVRLAVRRARRPLGPRQPRRRRPADHRR